MNQQQHYRPYTPSSASASAASAAIKRNNSPATRTTTPTDTPTIRSPSNLKLNQVPFRSGFQPKGVYRDRTEELITARNSRQESKRLEEARLQKRLEKLIQLHFPAENNQQSATQDDQQDQNQPSLINLSQKLIGIVKHVGHDRGEFGGINLVGQNGSIRAQEQRIVRWQEDGEVKECKYCQTSFGLRIRKHHCRLCGSVVCFSPPWTTGQRERCSTMIRFEWERATESRKEKGIHGRIIQLSEQEMGIVDDPHSVLDLISSTSAKPLPAYIPPKPRKGVRVCSHCLAIILRRQAMTYPPKIPGYIHLYASLKRIQDEIEKAIPEFQELLSSSKHPNSNLNPSSTSDLPMKLLTIRRKLLTNLSLFDAHSKKLIGQVARREGENGSEARLVSAITTRAGLFLRDHMSLIRSLGLLETQPTPQPKPSSSSTTTTSRATRPRPSSSSSLPTSLPQPNPLSSTPPNKLHVKNLSISSETNHSIHSQEDTHHILVQLNVLLEQENRIEGFLALAQSKRQLEDVASLKSSLDDLREEISNLKKSLL